MVKIIIDGTEIQESPEGWENITTTLRFDKELKGFFTVMDVSLTFWFDGYRMIKNGYDTYGHCHSYSLDILREDEKGNYIYIYKGTLFFKDVEFTEGVDGYSAKCHITDNSFFAKIANNKNIKAKVYVGKSKSGLSISPADYWRTTFFDPTNGTYYSHLTGTGYERNDTSFRVYDVLRFLVDYMSDGTVEFRSDLFSTGIGQGDMITCGKVLRFVTGAIGSGLTQELFNEAFPDLSFEEVFVELDKEYNLGFVSGYDGAKPYIRIEEYDYLYPNTQLQYLPNVEKIKRKTASDYLYAKMVTGSEGTTDETFLSFPETIRFLGFNAEEYVIVNNCNNDRELNIKNEWIVSSNTIEDLVVNGGTTAPLTYDNTIVLIRTTLDVGNIWGDADQSNWLSAAPPYFYNEFFNNANKALRYLKSVPASIAAYLSATDDTFTAESTNPDPTFPLYYDNGTDPERLIECDNEITDHSANYNNAAFYYDIPTTGVYTFYGLSRFEILNFAGSNIIDNQITVFLRRTDSSNVLISETSVVTLTTQLAATAGLAQIHSISGSAATVANATDRIYLYIKVDGDLVNYRIYPINKYGCIGTSNSGGVYQEYDPADFPIIRNQFDYPLSFKDFRTLQAQPLGLISFGVKDSKTYFAWIEEIKYKHFQAASSFTLISNETLNK